LAFLDGDDLVAREAEKHVNHLNNSSAVGLVLATLLLSMKRGNPLGIYQMSKGITPLYIIRRNLIGNGSTPVIRKEVFEVKFQDNLTAPTKVLILTNNCAIVKNVGYALRFRPNGKLKDFLRP